MPLLIKDKRETPDMQAVIREGDGVILLGGKWCLGIFLPKDLRGLTARGLVACRRSLCILLTGS